MEINTIALVGRAVRTPTLKTSGAGGSIVTLALAVNSKRKDSAGIPQPEVLYIDCIAFGKQAEIIAQYIIQGQEVGVIGKLVINKWKKEGESFMREKPEVIIREFSMGNRAKSASDKPKSDDSTEPELEYPMDEINPEDIPF